MFSPKPIAYFGSGTVFRNVSESPEERLPAARQLNQGCAFLREATDLYYLLQGTYILKVFGRGNVASEARHILLTLKWRNTMESVDQPAKKAIRLQPMERIRLVEAILYSLDKPDPDVEKSWIAESEARYKAYIRGELEATEWNEIRKRYEP